MISLVASEPVSVSGVRLVTVVAQVQQLRPSLRMTKATSGRSFYRVDTLIQTSNIYVEKISLENDIKTDVSWRRCYHVSCPDMTTCFVHLSDN